MIDNETAKDYKFIGNKIQSILKELVETSIEQWLTGALADPSKPLKEAVSLVKEQLDNSRKEATYKILEMFEIKEEYYK